MHKRCRESHVPTYLNRVEIVFVIMVLHRKDSCSSGSGTLMRCGIDGDTDTLTHSNYNPLYLQAPVATLIELLCVVFYLLVMPTGDKNVILLDPDLPVDLPTVH